MQKDADACNKDVNQKRYSSSTDPYTEPTLKCNIMRYIIYINVIYHYTFIVFLHSRKISWEIWLYTCQYVTVWKNGLDFLIIAQQKK